MISGAHGALKRSNAQLCGSMAKMGNFSLYQTGNPVQKIQEPLSFELGYFYSFNSLLSDPPENALSQRFLNLLPNQSSAKLPTWLVLTEDSRTTDF